MGKPRSHSPKVSTGVYDYLNSPRPQFADYVVSAKRPAQQVIKGTDISRRVSAAGPRKEVTAGDVNGARGFSNEVSRGKRPVHKAGKQSYKRV